MNVTPMLVVIVIQVLVFQFLAVRWSKALPGYLLSRAALPEDAADKLCRWEAHVGRARHLLGAVLLALTVFIGLLGSSAAWGKPVLALLSVVSATAFLVGWIRDRAVLASLAERAAPPTVRTAALEPRTLRSAYAPAWESIPFAIAVLTLTATGWAVVGGAGVSLLWLPSLQLAVAGGGLALSRWYARSSMPLSQRVRAGLGDPGTALAIDEWLRIGELRALLGATIGIVLFLAIKQGGDLLVVLGLEAPGALEWMEWGVVAALLCVFGSYVLAVTRASPGR